MKLTCSKCFGNKTYRGMGSMIIKCEPCKGTGWVDISTDLSKSECEPQINKKTRKDKRNAKEEGHREDAAS